MPRIDPRQGPVDFAGHERLPPTHAIVLNHCDPAGIELCHSIGAARVEQRALLLGLSPTPSRRAHWCWPDRCAASLLAVYSGAS
jgi:hypothetical protein